MVYEHGAEDSLPRTWEDFKCQIEFCTDTGIESLKKISDERWSGYVKRLREWVTYKNYPTEKAWRQLQAEKVLNRLKFMFYDSERSIQQECNLSLYEKNSYQKPRDKRRDQNEKNQDERYNDKTCYYCNKIGHIAKCCRKKDLNKGSNEVNMVAGSVQSNKKLVLPDGKKPHII